MQDINAPKEHKPAGTVEYLGDGLKRTWGGVRITMSEKDGIIRTDAYQDYTDTQGTWSARIEED